MRRPAWKGDPPRGPPRCADVGGGRALDRGGRADLRDSDDGGGGHAEGSRSEPRRSSAGCNRRGRGRSVCRWRRGSGNEGISPVAAPSAGDPRPAVRPDEDTAADAPGSRKTCDNPGWSSLCAFEDRGSSTRGLGASTPGPHLLLGTVGHEQVCLHRALPARASCLASTAGSALRRGSTYGRRGVRPWVRDPWIKKISIRDREAEVSHLPARCSENSGSTGAATHHHWVPRRTVSRTRAEGDPPGLRKRVAAPAHRGARCGAAGSPDRSTTSPSLGEG